jgi:hypothetical protein
LFAIGYTLDNNARPFEVNFNLLDKFGFSCNQNINVPYLTSDALTNVQNLTNPSVDNIKNSITISNYNISVNNKIINITFSCSSSKKETLKYKLKSDGKTYISGYGNKVKLKKPGLYFIELENEVLKIFVP